MFFVISHNPNVEFGFVDCSLQICRITLKDDYHKERLDMIPYSTLEFNFLETLAKTFNIPARKNTFPQENNSNNSTIRRIAIVMNTNCAFAGLYTDSSICFQQIAFEQKNTQKRSITCKILCFRQLSLI